MRRFIAFGPALVVLMACMVTLVAAPAAVRLIGYAETDAQVRLARQSLEADDFLERLNTATRNIASAVEPSVVHIAVDEPGRRGWVRQAQGSGWVFDQSGHIVTNAHVVRGARRITVQFQDGRQASADAVGHDPTTDIAVIRVKTDEGLFPAKRASREELRQGDRVYAFGSPFGFKFSMSEGIVSGLGRDPRTVIGQDGYTNFIQTDAAVNPGNSGGPLVNVRGAVVGMNVAIATGNNADGTTEGQSSGISFAIPLDTIEAVVGQLITAGSVSKGFLGITHGGDDERNNALLSASGYKGRGVVITDIAPGGPADAAGLKARDVMTKIDGLTIGTVPAMRSAISNKQPGDRVKVEVWRNGETLSFDVVLTTLGPSFVEIQEALAAMKRFGLDDVAQSVGGDIVVASVINQSPAAKAGLRPGQIITMVNAKPIGSVREFAEMIAGGGLAQGRDVTITVMGPGDVPMDVRISGR